MNVLELFAGSRSFSKVAQLKGFNTFTTDIEFYEGIDYVTDIMDFNYTRVPFKPDIIWASPPCTAFSVASIGRHWTGGKKAYIPKTSVAKQNIKLVYKTAEIINYYTPCYYFIENPRGLLRKLGIIEKELPQCLRSTVTYCQYGDKRMKPTDIWHNSMLWVPRPMCKNGDPCHISAPRGSNTGTQGRKNKYERSKVPQQLCEETIDSIL